MSRLKIPFASDFKLDQNIESIKSIAGENLGISLKLLHEIERNESVYAAIGPTIEHAESEINPQYDHIGDRI